MSDDRFNGVGRRGRQISLDMPDSASPSPRGSGPVRPIWYVVSVLLVILCLVVGAGGYYYSQQGNGKTQTTSDQPANTNQQPNQPGQSQLPGSNPSSPAGQRVRLNVCIVNFGAYFPVLLIPNDNPAYELNVIPLNFYTESYTDVVLPNIDNYQFINLADESEQIAMLKDGRCDILFTTTDVLAKHPGAGRMFTVIGQSDGADKTVGWIKGVTSQCQGRNLEIFNNLYQVDASGNQVGICVIAVAQDSVGYYQALSFLKLANIKPGQVRIDTYPTPEQASAACVKKLADFCSGWVPAIDDVLDPAKVGQGTTKTYVSSKSLKTIYDGIFESNQAKATKSNALQAFEEDWFVAVNMTANDLPLAAKKISEWVYVDKNGKSYSTNEYTFVYPGSEVDDLTAWFSTYAQASFTSQFPLLSNPNLMYSIWQDQRDVWNWSELTLDDGFDPTNMLDLSYIQALANRTDLNATNGFVDNSFSFFPAQMQPATREELLQLPTLVEIVCPNVSFAAGQATIDPNSKEHDSLISCGQQIKTLLNQSNLQILIIASAAHPGPDYGPLYKNCGTKVLSNDPNKNDYCWSVVVNRGSFTQGVFTAPPLLIPPQRIALDYQLGPLCMAVDAAKGLCTLQDSRFVTIQVKVGAAGLQ